MPHGNVEQHVQAYLTYLANRGLSDKHQVERERLPRAVPAGCELKRLAGLAADKLGAFPAGLQQRPSKHNPAPGPASARTKDTYRGAGHAFYESCVSTRSRRSAGARAGASAAPTSGPRSASGHCDDPAVFVEPRQNAGVWLPLPREHAAELPPGSPTRCSACRRSRTGGTAEAVPHSLRPRTGFRNLSWLTPPSSTAPTQS